jgi:hypothetical protein
MAIQKPAASLPPPPGGGKKLGLTYKQWTLDCVVTIAHAVSLDFGDQPHLYKNIPEPTADNLTDLQAKYGFDPLFPDITTRQRLMKPIFGQSDGHGSGNDSEFHNLRLKAVVAAAKFAENAQPTGFLALGNTVRSTSDDLRDHFNMLGRSLDETASRMTSIFNVAQSILKDVASSRFSVDGIDPNWPLDSTDPLGATLIQNITSQLTDLLPYVISHDMFKRIQQIANDGFESILIVRDQPIDRSTPPFDLTELIKDLYDWGYHLGLVGGASSQQQAPVQATLGGSVAPSPAPAPPTSVTAPPGMLGYRQ